MASQLSSSAPPAAGYPPAPIPAAGAPVTIFVSGTKVHVGSHRVVVDRYLSEGGFAHVYLVRVPTKSGGTETAVLKRVAVPDKDALASMRTEVETMKKLKGHKHIVTYIDSHASQLKGGGYEVFLLMEYCDGGGLIDFMNTRLKNRLTEPEILKIFSDVAEGVACMHYLKPPLLHRDLKVENILISQSGPSKLYKLCDFGSTAPPRPAASSAAEGRLIEEDVQKHTTLQYRSPEMVDVYRKNPIDEKSDIWALGVLLYKLCYYITPFEEQGRMAILTASFKYPAYPRFSDRLKALIASLLMADPQRRPNIYEVLTQVCSLRGTPVPVKDIYTTRTPSEARSNQRLPSPNSNTKFSSTVGISQVPLEQTKVVVPDIMPMRRGRPTSTQPVSSNKPIAGAIEGGSRDPFAALDSPSLATRSKAVDELAVKFPRADRFSLLQDEGSRFEFDRPAKEDNALSARVTIALADEMFAAKSGTTPIPDQSAPRLAEAVSVSNNRHPNVAQVRATQQPDVQKSLPARPKMVSTGTMTDASVSKPLKSVPVDTRPIWRVPAPKADDTGRRDTSERSRPVSQFVEREPLSAQGSSRRPVDGLRPPSLELARSAHRSHSADERLSPVNSGEQHHGIQRSVSQRLVPPTSMSHNSAGQDADGIEPARSSLDYLRVIERQDSASRGHQRRSSSITRLKRASMPPISASSAKNMFAGKFGNAFKRFEGGMSGHRPSSSRDPPHEDLHNLRSDPDLYHDNTDVQNASESAIDETEDLPPEMRRELERRQLASEERRVTEAAAAYRSGLGSGSGPRVGAARATAIQNRVKTLLDESTGTTPTRKTAQGYGKYTDIEVDGEVKPPEGPPPWQQQQQQQQPRSVAPPVGAGPRQTQAKLTPVSASLPASFAPSPPHRQLSARIQQPTTTGPRPNAPPKPVALRTGGSTTQPNKPSKPPEPLKAQPPLLVPEAGTAADVDWEDDFSKRYPRLSLETVETEITGGLGTGVEIDAAAVGGGDLQRSGRAQSARSGMRVRDV